MQSPEEWAWSSFRHYLTGAEGTVEVESHWTARRREHTGAPLTDQRSGMPLGALPFPRFVRKGGDFDLPSIETALKGGNSLR